MTFRNDFDDNDNDRDGYSDLFADSDADHAQDDASTEPEADAATGSQADAEAVGGAEDAARAERRAELQELVDRGGPNAALAEELIAIMDERAARQRADAETLQRLTDAEAFERGGGDPLTTDEGRDLIRSRVIAERQRADEWVIRDGIASKESQGYSQADIAVWVRETRAAQAMLAESEARSDALMDSEEYRAVNEEAWDRRGPVEANGWGLAEADPFWGDSLVKAEAEMRAIAERVAARGEA